MSDYTGAEDVLERFKTSHLWLEIVNSTDELDNYCEQDSLAEDELCDFWF